MCIVSEYQPKLHIVNGGDLSDNERRRNVDNILNFIGYGPLQFIAFCLAGLSAIAFGLDMVIFAFVDIPVQQEWKESV